MIIETKKFKDVNRAPYNPRVELKPGMPEYEKLKKSILKFEQVLPMVYNSRSNTLVGGHQTMTVLNDMGITESQMSIVDLNDADEKTLNLALNRIGGDWDKEKLAELFDTMSLPEIQLGGFDIGEIDELSTLDENVMFTLEDFEFDSVYEPCWFVIRAPIDDYEKIKNKLMELDATVEGSLDGQLKP